MPDATVFVGDTPAATLKREPDGVTSFSYLPEYRATGGLPVATTLPLSDRPVITRAGGVPTYFAGLLPEGRRLTALRRSIKASADDEFAMLLEIGSDLVGDVRVLPEGDDRSEPETVITLDADDAPLFEDLLADKGIIDRVGLAGVQEKVSARMISLPVTQANARYILKLSPPEYPHVVENEAFFIALAHRLRIPAVEARLVSDAKGVNGLLVRRFDRPPSGGRLGVEDACQALDRFPADKYNVSMEQAAESLIRACAAERVAAARLFEQIYLAWLTGNGDVHAKNISILRDPAGEWRVAPAYDLPSTALYGDMTFALDVNGEDSDLTADDFLGLARHLDLPQPAALRRMRAIDIGTAALPEMLEQADLPFEKTRMTDLLRELDRRRALLEI